LIFFCFYGKLLEQWKSVPDLMQHPELAHPHDLLVRRFLPDPELMADLLRYYPQNSADQRMVELLDLTRLECKDPVTVNERRVEIRGDLRFSTSFKGSDRESNVYLLFEHQSTKDSDFRFRGLDYIVQEYKKFRERTKGREKFPYPIVLILYHGTVPWERIPEMDDLIEIVPGMKTGLLDYLLILVDISPLMRGQFRGHPVLQAVLESLQLGSKGELADNFERVIERLAAVKDDPRMDYWLPSFGLYAMSVEEIEAEQVAKAFSKVVNKEEAHKMATTTAEKLLTKGKAEAVLTIIRKKFKKIPKEIEETVLAMSDSIALESLLEHAMDSDTLDEFVTALK
jgi:hypothetical protein